MYQAQAAWTTIRNFVHWRQRVIVAFLHERSIDKPTYKEQLDLLNEEIALAELGIHETRIDEMDLDAALNLATNALSNAARFWILCTNDQNSAFNECCFQMV